jgi:hypothetical protein
MSNPFFYGLWPVNPDVKPTIEHEAFKGGDALVLQCTQLPGKPSRQKKIVAEWCEFFKTPTRLRELYVSTRISVALFEAICHQTQLLQFGFKWGPIQDLSPIAELSKLTHLEIGSCSIIDLAPIAKLKSLKQLAINNAKNVSDYAPLGELKNLEYLHIDGDLWSANKRAPIDDLQFVPKLKNLRGLSLDYVRIDDPDWHKAIMKLPKLEQLFVPKVSCDVRDALLTSLRRLKLHNLS